MFVSGKAIVLIHLCLLVSAKIEIRNLTIPNGVEDGKIEEIVLDCEYTFQDIDNDTLVVKWFYPDSDKMIYQWIPGRGNPTVVSKFRPIIDFYKVSDNPMTMYRALKIKKVSPEITGNYTCSVSSDSSEDRKGKRLVVYKKADKVEFIHMEQSDMHFCAAYGIYPKPIMNIYVLGSNLTKLEDGDDNDDNNLESNERDEDTVDVSNGVYNVTSSFKYLKSEIKEQTQFICDLWIPDTDYHETRQSLISLENAGSLHRLSSFLLAFLPLIFIYYC